MQKSNQSRTNRDQIVSKHNIQTTITMETENKLTDKVYVDSQNVQSALKAFINRHRSTLQQQVEQNQKQAQQNTILSVRLSEHEVIISALNGRIATAETELAMYKKEQAELIESKKLLHSKLITNKKRSHEFMANSDKEKKELQETNDRLLLKLKERDAKEEELKNMLNAIRQELHAKHEECNKSNDELSKVRSEIVESKQQLVELEKLITNLQEELKEKDETINTIHLEQAIYKIETEKNINKMQEIQRIFYPNAANPLPPRAEVKNSRPTQPASVSVEPRPQSRAVFKRSSSSSSSVSETDSDYENIGLLRGWDPAKNGGLQSSIEGVRGFDRGSTDIPATPESSEGRRRKRFRH